MGGEIDLRLFNHSSQRSFIRQSGKTRVIGPNSDFRRKEPACTLTTPRSTSRQFSFSLLFSSFLYLFFFFLSFTPPPPTLPLLLIKEFPRVQRNTLRRGGLKSKVSPREFRTLIRGGSSPRENIWIPMTSSVIAGRFFYRGRIREVRLSFRFPPTATLLPYSLCETKKKKKSLKSLLTLLIIRTYVGIYRISRCSRIHAPSRSL